ncbi:uncharacterized protein P884DRAFT_276270 [Thermothelomyces heterothallicus CBS 202.75]|uniref:uncharacterized protein n=1 Tax=Thermothelomyces heterothallicus CBS 202.75 TaxID=1149848 RepID=UPI00374411A0
MADNTNPTSSWFRPFGRSNTSNTNQQQQQQQQQEQRQSPPLQTRQTFHNVLTHISTSTDSPTNESPPRGPGHHSHHHQNQHHQHHHRKSAGATLRTVSSFLNLKSSTSKSGGGTGKSHVWQLSSRSGNGAATVAKLEHDPTIRAPASLAMLPLTDVDYGSPSSCADGWSGSGRSAGRESRDGEGGGERTWHNPNVMQMTEMLSSVMTRMAPGDRLDPTYHSCIFSLIEGFYKLTRRLQDVEEQLAEIKDLRERELDQFRGMTKEWMETSEAYKAEVKRLELSLAKESKDGVASVALARHGSLVDRVGSKRFHARLERLNGLHDQGICSIPRILDSQNDVTLSRILEQRELEERMAHQRRGEGRIRAAPVLIHPRGAPEPRDFLGDTLRAARQPPVAIVERDPFAVKAQENPTADSTVRPGLESHSSSSIGNESSSSSSSTPSSDSQTDAGEEFVHSSISCSGESNDRPRKRRQKQSICSESSYQAYHGNREFPRAGEGTGESSGQQSQQSLLGPPLREKGRRRRYSFEIGDDELLSIAPRSGSEGPHHPRVPSAGEETRVEGNRSLGITPDSGVAQVSATAAKPSSNWSPGSISHSTSADTVRWVGEDGCCGDGAPEGSNTRQGQTKAKP